MNTLLLIISLYNGEIADSIRVESIKECNEIGFIIRSNYPEKYSFKCLKIKEI